MFGAFGGQALLPNGEPAYSILNVAKVIEKPTTLGVADSDLTNMSQEDVNKTLDKLQSIGVNDVRLFIPWADVETSKGQYDWTKIDKIMDAAKKRDMGVIATITHSPNWAVAGQTYPARISPPDNPADYGDFAAAVTNRYKGTVSGYEIWNDTNSGFVYGGKADPQGYTALLQNAYEKIKSVDPSVTVIAGVFGAVPTSSTDLNAPTFLDQMYANNAKGYFDAISYHPYQYTTPYSQGGDLQGSPLNEVKQMRAIMAERGDGTKLIWASEYGFPTSATGGETQQAAYIADFIKAWSTQEGAGPMFIYTTRDTFASTTIPAPGPNATQAEKDAYYENVFGIYRYDWSAKPAAQTIADFIASQKPVAAPPNVLALFLQNFVNSITQAFTNFTSIFTNAINSFFQAIQRIFAPPVAGPPANTGGPGSGGPAPQNKIAANTLRIAATTEAAPESTEKSAPQALIAPTEESTSEAPAPQTTTPPTTESSAPVTPSTPVTPITPKSKDPVSTGSGSAVTPSATEDSTTPSTESLTPSIISSPSTTPEKQTETVGAVG
ncbi:cellulase family glycosylhydrolase [Williamsia sp. M5A3_1d]